MDFAGAQAAATAAPAQTEAVPAPVITDVEALALPETATAPAPAVSDSPDPGLNIMPNVLSDLKRLRAQIGAGAEPVDIPIPGYGGLLVARFRWVPADRLAATAKSLRSIKDPTQQQLAAVADTLVATNCEILVQADDKLESLQHEGLPVTFANGAGLALALGLPKPASARECVTAVFGNEYAMVDVGQRVMTWLEDTSRQVDEAHLGE